MPQAVRRNIAVNVGAEFDIFINHSPDRARRDARALIIEKNRLVVAFGGRAIIQKYRTRFIEIIHQGLQRRFAERQNALLFRFP